MHDFHRLSGREDRVRCSSMRRVTRERQYKERTDRDKRELIVKKLSH
jgi:hypothetical protein